MRNYKLDKEPFRPGINYKQDALFQAIFEESPDGIFLLHPDNFQILDSNAKAQQLFQVQDKLELTGRQSFSLQESEPVEFSKKIFIDTINSGAEHSQEMAFRSVKGNIFWGRCSIRKVETGQGDIIVFRVRRVVDYLKTAEMLADLGVDSDIVEAIKLHNENATDIPRSKPFHFALAAGETITGLIFATTYVYPEKKLAVVKPKSVVKRMKEKSFAASVKRENIMECEKIGISIDEFAALSIAAMLEISEEVGL